MAPDFDFGAVQRPHRRPSLTPMVDVVFLLLVFFMLAARFGLDKALPLTPPGPATGAAYAGAPRLVTVTPEAVYLNGIAVAEAALPASLAPLMPTPDAAVIVRAREGATLQRVVAVLDRLGAAGAGTLVLAE